MTQIPVKFRVVQLICQNENVTNQAILEALKREYPHDRSVNEKGVEDYLLTLTAVGLINQTSVSLDNNGKLILCYKITEHGTHMMKYVN